MLDPRITAQDLDDDLMEIIGGGPVGDVRIVVTVRANFLTVQVNSDDDSPKIMWIPYSSLIPAMGRVSKAAGC